ncbi:MAG: endoglucanase [Algoriphagus sp.]|jgi:endoglucanase|tara:strand:+ start:1266 stop:2261 length:996 start_codon:yes stop_codon:yes gene_type:complete
MPRLIFYLILIFYHFTSFSLLKTSFHGINISGMEKVWEQPDFSSKIIISKIRSARTLGFNSFRLPIAVEHFIDSDPRFFKELRKVVRYTNDNKLELVLVYFDHMLTEENSKCKSEEVGLNWNRILKYLNLKGQLNGVYVELANEPQLNPQTWEIIWPNMVEIIRDKNPDIPIIIGATNFNSLFELSRTTPLDLKNLIYTFHYYEPYIFTHQGTEWTGNQNSTTGIPYPYQKEIMPQISAFADGTSGKVNYRDYYLTGNKVALEDKIGQISSWARKHQVTLWCTEYGASVNADSDSRMAYLIDVNAVLNDFQIPGFVWEWEGNFGIKELVRN